MEIIFKQQVSLNSTEGGAKGVEIDQRGKRVRESMGKSANKSVGEEDDGKEGRRGNRWRK